MRAWRVPVGRRGGRIVEPLRTVECGSCAQSQCGEQDVAASGGILCGGSASIRSHDVARDKHMSESSEPVGPWRKGDLDAILPHGTCSRVIFDKCAILEDCLEPCPLAP